MSDSIKYSKSYIFKSALVIGLGTLSFGFSLGSANSIVPYLQEAVFPDYPKFLVNLAGTLFFCGAGLGSLIGGYLAAFYGRRKSMMITDIGIIFTAFFTMSTNIYILLIEKLGIGTLSGMNSILNPLYLTETAPPIIRGKIGSTSNLLACFGIFLSFLMGLKMPKSGERNDWWQYFSIVLITISCIRLIYLSKVYLYDTPFYLVMKGDYKVAKRHLSLIYGDGAESELERMKVLKKETKSSEDITICNVLFSNKRKTFFYGCLISSFFTACGTNLIVLYSGSIFATQGNIDPFLFNFKIGLLSFLTTFIAPFTTEKFGRKYVLAFGNISTGLILTLIIIFSRLEMNAGIEYLVYLFIICYSPSLGAVIWVYLTDILDDILFSYVKVFGWINSFIATSIFPSLVESFGLSYSLMIFAIWSFANAYFVINKLKETKGLSKFESMNLFDTTIKKNGEKKDHLEFKDEL